MRRHFFILATSVVFTVGLVTLQQTRGRDNAPQFDLVIRNGRLIDGLGGAWVRGDVGVLDGRIAAVGALGNLRAGRVIDAGDRFVAPGFIDSHSHAADGLARLGLQQGQPLLAQGVTTIVANPDGGGPTLLTSQRAALERRGLGVNVAPLIGHGSVRERVIGMADRPATPDELQRMDALVRDGMEQGAFGLSTGLFYAPGSYAPTDEVIELMRTVARVGGVHQSHIRDEGHYSVGVLAAVDEIIRIAEETHTTGIVTHMKALGADSWGIAPELVARMDAARARGVQVFADQYCYEASSTSLVGALVPRWVQAGGAAAMRNRLTTAETRRRALVDIRANIGRRGGPSAIYIAHYEPQRRYEGETLGRVAADLGLSVEDAAIALLLKSDASIVSFNMSEPDIELIMRQPWTMTSSDGGLVFPTEGKPHPRNYGAFTRKLERYVRERGTVSLESAVRSMTGLPAKVYGLVDRGVLRPGAWADLVVFDLQAVHEMATYDDPHQLARGMAYVLVNGVLVVDGGGFTPALPGKVLVHGPAASGPLSTTPEGE
jgi:N-acyl-D-amino-acid deacylase